MRRLLCTLGVIAITLMLSGCVFYALILTYGSAIMVTAERIEPSTGNSVDFDFVLTAQFITEILEVEISEPSICLYETESYDRDFEIADFTVTEFTTLPLKIYPEDTIYWNINVDPTDDNQQIRLLQLNIPHIHYSTDTEAGAQRYYNGDFVVEYD